VSHLRRKQQTQAQHQVVRQGVSRNAEPSATSSHGDGGGQEEGCRVGDREAQIQEDFRKKAMSEHVMFSIEKEVQEERRTSLGKTERTEGEGKMPMSDRRGYE
jgi:hypothetical protein